MVMSMTTQQLERDINILDLAIQAEEYRRSLKRFVVDFWPLVEPEPFVDGWCIDAICEHLQALTAGQIQKLVINIPPRHTKSTICSVLWQVWEWTLDPTTKFLTASYNLNLALRDNRRKRNLVESERFQQLFGVQLSSDQNAKYFFENTAKGYMLACSVGSSATGSGGNRLVIDDPHAASEANSDLERFRARDWFKETWSSRANKTSDRWLVIGQRIHDDDVCGEILKNRTDWVHLCLPSEFEPERRCFTSIGWSDPRQTPGELLWPQRFDQKAIDDAKHDLGSTAFAAQHQQSPTPAGGGQFKKEWFRYFEETDEHYILFSKAGRKAVKKAHCWRAAVMDLAISEKQDADFTNLQTWDITPNLEILLLDQARGHLSNPEQQKTVYKTYIRYMFELVAIESVYYQLALVQQLRDLHIFDDELGEWVDISIPTQEWFPGHRDKVARASVGSLKMEQGDMYFRRNAHYLADLESEIVKFPKGKKDQVDTLSMMADIIATRKAPRLWGGEKEPKREMAELSKEASKRVQEYQRDPFAYADKFGGDS